MSSMSNELANMFKESAELYCQAMKEEDKGLAMCLTLKWMDYNRRLLVLIKNSEDISEGRLWS